MKKNIFTLITIAVFALVLADQPAFSQCIPADSTECPDPENNGQICPDTLPPAYLNEFYSQVATILPPLTYGDTIVVTLHHITLIDIGNLPDGITWQSNDPNNEFMAGEYYCIILEGTPDSVGSYPLQIVIDVYIFIPGFPPIYAGQIIDSTSLVMEVLDPAWISDGNNQAVTVRSLHPNPFRLETRLDYFCRRPEQMTFEVFDMTGQKVFSEPVSAAVGENSYLFRNPGLVPGQYLYFFRTEGAKTAGSLMITR